MMGGALGLAILASLTTARTDHLRTAGNDSLIALTGGYHLAFVAGALAATAAAVLGAILLRAGHLSLEPAGSPPADAELLHSVSRTRLLA